MLVDILVDESVKKNINLTNVFSFGVCLHFVCKFVYQNVVLFKPTYQTYDVHIVFWRFFEKKISIKKIKSKIKYHNDHKNSFASAANITIFIFLNL